MKLTPTTWHCTFTVRRKQTGITISNSRWVSSFDHDCFLVSSFAFSFKFSALNAFAIQTSEARMIPRKPFVPVPHPPAIGFHGFTRWPVQISSSVAQRLRLLFARKRTFTSSTIRKILGVSRHRVRKIFCRKFALRSNDPPDDVGKRHSIASFSFASLYTANVSSYYHRPGRVFSTSRSKHVIAGSRLELRACKCAVRARIPRVPPKESYVYARDISPGPTINTQLFETITRKKSDNGKRTSQLETIPAHPQRPTKRFPGGGVFQRLVHGLTRLVFILATG